VATAPPRSLSSPPLSSATQMETSYGSARALMADALDLRHRHPELWQLVLSGAVPAWKARKVARATRHLSRSAALQVDAAVAPAITALPWGRFESLLTAKIIEADPYAAEQQAKIWEAERFVRAGRTDQHGLKLLIAKANAGDVVWFLATVNRIAEILRLQGDLAPATYAARGLSASSRNPRWHYSCCGTSVMSSTPPASRRNRMSPSTMNPTPPTITPLRSR
jgi:hypothetical protein